MYRATSTALCAVVRASKKESWMARKRAQSWSSSARRALPAAFQRRIRSRKAAEVAAQSVEAASGSASAMMASLSDFDASRREFSSAKCALRRRV